MQTVEPQQKYFGPTVYEGTSSLEAALGLFGQLQCSNSHLVAEHLFLPPWGLHSHAGAVHGVIGVGYQSEFDDDELL